MDCANQQHQWINISDQQPSLGYLCFFACDKNITIGARIIINAEDDQRPIYCGILGAPRFDKVLNPR